MFKILSRFCLLLLLSFSTTFAQEVPTVNVYFFHADGCPHCEKEIEFLYETKDEHPIQIWDYEITATPSHLNLLKSLESKLDTTIGGTPFTVVGESYFSGFMSATSTGAEIRQAIENVIAGKETQILTEIIDTPGDGLFEKKLKPTKKETPKPNEKESKSATCDLDSDVCTKPPEKKSKTITLPIFGDIETKHVSLPVLTFIIALLDGFNPCAMWVLMFLISLLLGMKDRKRMWILGSTFIAASAFVYFLIMLSWLKLLLFLGFLFWIRLGIGLLALGAGGYYLYDAFTNKDGVCKVSHGGSKQKVFQKLKNFAHHPSLLLALGGIILLAFAVNVVEAVCSAGLPVVFNEILILSNLESWQYYAYMVFYILIFMLDDLIVFFIAMTTLHYVHLNNKYARYSHLIGGILMVILGILLIFKPQWLMFG